MEIPHVNGYLAHKQHLLPDSRGDDVAQVVRDLVALHATAATGPYFSLWTRVRDFRREMLEDALYEQRVLVKLLCMRVTLHVVASDEAVFFYRAFPPDFFERPMPVEFRSGGLLARAGLCSPEEAEALLADLHQRVLAVMAEDGPLTTQQIGRRVPEFAAKIHHDVGKAYEGEFSIGSRLMGDMCARGLLVRTRPRGTWRSSLYEYVALPDWLPDLDLESVTQAEARAWLVRRYLAAFGPATPGDVQWWTGLTKGETQEALDAIASELAGVAIEGLDEEHLMMLADDIERLRDFAAPDSSYIFMLPSLDPYIMGYSNRRRFLAQEHRKKVFDRAGNAVPTVWVDGRVAGVWGQRKDGRVFCELFESVDDAEGLLADEVRRLEDFLDGETLPPGIRTPFTRSLE